MIFQPTHTDVNRLRKINPSSTSLTLFLTTVTDRFDFSILISSSILLYRLIFQTKSPSFIFVGFKINQNRNNSIKIELRCVVSKLNCYTGKQPTDYEDKTDENYYRTRMRVISLKNGNSAYCFTAVIP